MTNWIMSIEGLGASVYVVTDTTPPQYVCDLNDDHVPAKTVVERAQLIASAPELLSLLKRALEHVTDDYLRDEIRILLGRLS